MVIIGMLVGKVIQLELVGLSKNCSAFVAKTAKTLNEKHASTCDNIIMNA